MKPRVLFVLSGLIAFRSAARACEVCEAQQPKILRGLTHGAGPQGSFDYIIVLATVAVVLVALAYAIKFIVRPGESEPSHIKRIVLQEDYHGT